MDYHRLHHHRHRLNNRYHLAHRRAKMQMLCKMQQVIIVNGTLGVFSSNGLSKQRHRHFSLPNALLTITLVLFNILLNLHWSRVRFLE